MSDFIKSQQELAPGFENTKTGEVTYDAGVQEYMARIKHITSLTGVE